MHLFKQSALALALGMGAGVANATVVLTFSDTTTNQTPLAGACSTISWANTGILDSPTGEGSFRMCDPSGAALGGGQPLHKDVMNGGETWTFNDSGAWSAVSGTPLNPGAFAGAAPSAGTNSTPQQGAAFFGPTFNFLAPVTGSLAGAAYPGAGLTGGTVIGGSTGLFTPVMEAQWGGTYFPLGSAGGTGITWTMTVTPTSATTFNFILMANEQINASEDPGAAGFTNWTAQWNLAGSGVTSGQHSVVPVPAAVWLFGSGLLGLVGVARRRKAK